MVFRKMKYFMPVKDFDWFLLFGLWLNSRAEKNLIGQESRDRIYHLDYF